MGLRLETPAAEAAGYDYQARLRGLPGLHMLNMFFHFEFQPTKVGFVTVACRFSGWRLFCETPRPAEHHFTPSALAAGASGVSTASARVEPSGAVADPPAPRPSQRRPFELHSTRREALPFT